LYVFVSLIPSGYVHLKLMEKNSVMTTPAAIGLLPPTTRNTSPDLLRARIAILATLQSHDAEAQKYILLSSLLSYRI
jgi:hypothetical protein